MKKVGGHFLSLSISMKIHEKEMEEWITTLPLKEIMIHLKVLEQTHVLSRAQSESLSLTYF